MASDSPRGDGLRRPSAEETLIILLRHAESTWNVERRFQGQSRDVPLSERGVAQARAAARWLANRDLGSVRIYTSDMQRARHTAELVAEALSAPVFTSEALREINLGMWQGLTREEVEARWPGELAARRANIENHRAEGGETASEMKSRVYAFFNEILSQHRGDTVILVSHGGTLSVLRAAVEGWNLQEAWSDERARLGNTGITVLRYNHVTREAAAELSGYQAHLEGTESDSGDTE